MVGLAARRDELVHDPAVAADEAVLGLLAVERVNAECERLNRLFGSGPNAARVASVLNSVRGQVLAAEARLSLLAHKARVAGESS
jgi:hypothetical protein